MVRCQQAFRFGPRLLERVLSNVASLSTPAPPVCRLLSATLQETVLGSGWRSFSQVGLNQGVWASRADDSDMIMRCTCSRAVPAGPDDALPCLRVPSILQAAAPAVFVDKNTKLIVQGLTGKNGSFHTEQVGGNCSRGVSSAVGLCCGPQASST